MDAVRVMHNESRGMCCHQIRDGRLHPERLVSPCDGPILSSQPSLKLDPYAHLHLDLLSQYLSDFLVISSQIRVRRKPNEMVS